MSDRLKIIMRGFPKFMSAASEETHWLKRSMKTGVRYLSQDSSTVTYRVRTVSAGSYLYMAAEKKSWTLPRLRTMMNYTAHGKSKYTVRDSLSPVYRLRASGNLLSTARTWNGMQSGFRLTGEQITRAHTTLHPHIDVYQRMNSKSVVGAHINVLSKSWIALESPLYIQSRLRTTIYSYGVMAESMKSGTGMFTVSRIHAPHTMHTRAAVIPWDAMQTVRAYINRNSSIRTAMSISKQRLHGKMDSPGVLRVRQSFRNRTSARPRNQYRINTVARPLTGYPVTHTHTLTVRTEQHAQMMFNGLPVAFLQSHAQSLSFAHLYGQADAPNSSRTKAAANQSTFGNGRIAYGLSREMFAQFGYRVESDDCAYRIRTQLHFRDQYYGKIVRPVYHSVSVEHRAHLTAMSETYGKALSQLSTKPRYLMAAKNRATLREYACIYSGRHVYPRHLTMCVVTEQRAGIRQYPKLILPGVIHTGISTHTNTYAQIHRSLFYGTRAVFTGALNAQARDRHKISGWIHPILRFRSSEHIALSARNDANARGWYRSTPTANALIDEELCIRTHSTASSETRSAARRSFLPVARGFGVGRDRHSLRAAVSPVYGYPVRPEANLHVSTMSTAHQSLYSRGQLSFLEKHTVVGSLVQRAHVCLPHHTSARSQGRMVFHNAGRSRYHVDGLSYGAVLQSAKGLENVRHLQSVITNAVVSAASAARINAASSAHSLLELLTRVRSEHRGYTRALSAARYQVTDALRCAGARYSVRAVTGFPAHSLHRTLNRGTRASGALVAYGMGNRPVKQYEQVAAMEHIYICCAKRPALVGNMFRLPVRYFARPMERQRLSVDTPDALSIAGFRIPSKARLGTTSQTYSGQHYHGQPEARSYSRNEANAIAGFLVSGEKRIQTRARSNSFGLWNAGSREGYKLSYRAVSHNGLYSQSLAPSSALQHSAAALSFYASSEANVTHTMDAIGRGSFYASAWKAAQFRDRASSYMELAASSNTTATWDTYVNGNILLPFAAHIPLLGHREVKTSAALDSHGRERNALSGCNDATARMLVSGQSDPRHGQRGSGTMGMISAPREKYRVAAQCNVFSHPAGEE